MEKERKLEICRVSCYYQKLSLTWPTEAEEFNPSKWFYISQFIFVVTVAAPAMTLFVLHLIKAIQEGDIDISEDLAVLTALIGMTLAMIIFVVKQHDLAILISDLSDFKEFGKPPLFDSVEKKFQFVAHFGGVYALVGSLIYNGIKIHDVSNCRRLRKIQEACGIVVPVWTPFDSDHWLKLLLVGVYMLYFIVTVDRGVVILSVQMYEIASHIQLRIDQLNNMLLTCFDGDRKEAKIRLNSCIRYHKKLIDFSIRFNQCYTYEMFLYLVTVAIICGCLENQITKHFDVGALIHIFGWTATLFVSCLSGQILIDSSTSIADAAFNSKWYEADVNLRKDLILIIMRSQKPLSLQTGPFNVLRFSLFVSIMKMSYSIYTLLT